MFYLRHVFCNISKLPHTRLVVVVVCVYPIFYPTLLSCSVCLNTRIFCTLLYTSNKMCVCLSNIGHVQCSVYVVCCISLTPQKERNKSVVFCHDISQ